MCLSDSEPGTFWISIPHRISIHRLLRSSFINPKPSKQSNPSIWMLGLPIRCLINCFSVIDEQQKRSWIFRLLAVGCLSLAAKMEESKTPKLSSLQVEGFDMESKAIQRMELYVLNTLDWRMSSVTPFSYLQYLIRTIFVDSNPQGLLSKAAKFIMSTVKGTFRSPISCFIASSFANQSIWSLNWELRYRD